MENVTPASAKRALAALDQASATAPAPTKQISKKIIAAIDAMVSGECKKISEAAEKVGLARESLSRALNKPHVAELMRQKVLRSLAIAASRAGATKVELLDSPSELVPRSRLELRPGPRRHPARRQPERKPQYRSEGRLRDRPERRPAAHADHSPCRI
jgi:DNA-binding phage protein